jgi:WD40 repeat protein
MILINLWQTGSSRPVITSQPVMSHFARNGRIVIPGDSPPSFVYIAASAASSVGAAITSDAHAHVFDASRAEIISSFEAHPAMVTGISLSNESQLLSTCCDSGGGSTGNEVSLWDMRSLTGVPICTFGVSSYVHYAKHCICVGNSCTGRIIGAGTDAGVLIWDVRKPEGLFRHVSLHPEDVSCLKFHPFADATFLSGDDLGNICLFDLDAGNDEDGQLFYSLDQSAVFQCGFLGLDTVWTLRRTAGIRLWNIEDCSKFVTYDDLRGDGLFGYPIDAHWCGERFIVVGGDSDGGVCLLLCSEDEVKVFEKMDKIHGDCVNCSYLDILSDGNLHLYLGGDGGEMSFWSVIPESE